MTATVEPGAPAFRRALQPFALTERVRDSYRRYLVGRHRLAEPKLQQALQDLVMSGTGDGQAVDARGPYIALARARSSGRTAEELAEHGVILPETAALSWGIPEALYASQVQAIRQVRDGINTLVTTGTGSGKTEAFLIPLIDGVIRDRRESEGKSAVRAVILYPMNALANDQRDRLRSILRGAYAKHGITFVLFIGTLPYSAKDGGPDLDLDTGEYLTRAGAEKGKPDIILTNYTMLELLLIRESQRELFDPNLRYLVLDEVHSYKGALGTEIACLVRRLRAHAGLKRGMLTCVGTSATVKEDDGDAKVADFASHLFGEPFKAEHVVAEEWAEPGVGPASYPPPLCELTDDDLAGLRGPQLTDDALVTLAERLCGRASPEGDDGPQRIRTLLAGNGLVRAMEEELARGPVHLRELAERLTKREERAGAPIDSVEREIKAYLLCGSASTIDERRRIVSPPALQPQVHMFFHGLENLTVCMKCQSLLTDGQTRHLPCDAIALPLASCATCGEDAVKVRAAKVPDGHANLMAVLRAARGLTPEGASERGATVVAPGFPVVGDTTPGTDLDELLFTMRGFTPRQTAGDPARPAVAPEEDAELDDDDQLEMDAEAPTPLDEAGEPAEEAEPAGEEEAIEIAAAGQQRNRVLPAWLCPRCGWLALDNPGPTCPQEGCGGEPLRGSVITPVGLRQPRKRKGRKPAERPGISKCPWCGDWSTTGRDIVAPWATFTAPGVAILTEETLDDLADQELKRRTLIFSDNRQDAAHQAGFINDYHRQNVVRQVLYNVLKEREGEALSVKGVIPQFVFDRLRELGMITREDGTVVKPYQVLGQQEQAAWLRAIEAMIMDEFCRGGSRRQTMETLGLVEVCYDLAPVTQSPTFSALRQDLGWGEEETVGLLRGLLDIFRRGRAVDWPWYQQDPRSAAARDHHLYVQINDPRNRLRYGYVARRFSQAPSGYKLAGTREKGGAYVNVLVGEKGVSTWLKYLAKVGIPDRDTAAKVTSLCLEVLEDIGLVAEHQLLARWGATKKALLVRWEHVLLKAGPTLELYRCNRCHRVWEVRLPEVDQHGQPRGHACFKRTCKGDLQPFGPDREDYQVQTIVGRLPRPLTVAEHSAQVPGGEREELERQFKEEGDVVHALACTPTMELGVDIGDLAAILLRNVPPSPANYAQRGGRAGRRLRMSAVLAFCGPSPHDRYYFDRATDIIAGRIRAPRFRLDNQEIVRRQARSYILEHLREPLPRYLGDLLDNPERTSPAWHMPAALLDEVRERQHELSMEVYDLLKDDAAELPWWSQDEAQDIVRHFPQELQRAFQHWGDFIGRLFAEQADLAQKIGPRGDDRDLIRLRQIIRDWTPRHEEAQGWGGDRRPDVGYTLTYLRERGFLPSYMFPVDPCTLHVWEGPEGEYRISRESEIALSEFAPGNIVYARGSKYQVTGLEIRAAGTNLRGTDWLKNVQIHGGDERCSFAQLVAPGEQARAYCPYDNHELPEPVHVIEARDFTGRTVERISADEAVRLRTPFDVRKYLIGADIAGAHYAYPFVPMVVCRDQPFIFLNYGRRTVQGFPICPECGALRPGGLDEDVPTMGGVEKGHRKGCASKYPAEGAPLAYRFRSDALVIEVRPPEVAELSEADLGTKYVATLRNAIIAGAQAHLEIEAGEIGGFDRRLGAQAAQRTQIVLYDSVPGGAGYLEQIAAELPNVAAAAYDILYGHRCSGACYACLLHYFNQMEHTLLDKELVRDILLALRLSSPVSSQPLTKEHALADLLRLQVDTRIPEMTARPPKAEQGGIGVVPPPDVRTWEKALQLVESPIEKILLDALRGLGAPPPVAQLNVFDSDGRFICRPDFTYPEYRLTVFCDGAMWHLVKEQALKDFEQRRRLTLNGWHYLPFWGKEIRDDARRCARVILQLLHT